MWEKRGIPFLLSLRVKSKRGKKGTGPLSGENMMKKYWIVLIIGLISSVEAGPYWKKLLKDYKLNYKDSAFCYTNSKGQLEGDNIHMKVRLASVSKLMTTLWAVERLKPSFQYETKFYFHDKKLHIEGAKDPVFSKRKLFFILSQLNNLGITKIDRLTFDKNMMAFAYAERGAGTVFRVSTDKTKKTLKDYFHTPDWEKLKKSYRIFIANTPENVLEELQIKRSLDDIKLEVKDVKFVDKNPLADTDGAEKVYQHLSPQIAKYLKVMNIKSNNFIADQVFFQLGGVKAFRKYMNKKVKDNYGELIAKKVGFNKDEDLIRMYTGSGLPVETEKYRYDNYATCALVIKLIEELDVKLGDLQSKIQKLVAVPAVDRGTFSSRLKSRRIMNAMVAKTGSLKHTSALAGMLATQMGRNYFGIFNHVRGSKGNARIIQDKIVLKLMEDLGGKMAFSYTPEFFFPAVEPMR